MSTDFVRIAITFFVLLYSVIIHEMCHAYSAYLMGDSTGKDDGRLSWNPLRHIDFFYTILMPVVLLVASGGRFALGGAKPVRINALNFRNPSKGMMISAACGPFSNLALSVGGFFLLFGLWKLAPSLSHPQSLNAFALATVVYLNLLLAVFNLIPIPPLDGSRVFRYILPEAGKGLMDRLELFGIFIIIILLSAGGIDRVLAPVFNWMAKMFVAGFGTEYTSLLFKNLGF